VFGASYATRFFEFFDECSGEFPSSSSSSSSFELFDWEDARRACEPAEHQCLPSGPAIEFSGAYRSGHGEPAWSWQVSLCASGCGDRVLRCTQIRGNTSIFRPWHVSLVFAPERRALQLKDRMPSILHRLSGTENQVLDVTLARQQACVFYALLDNDGVR